MELHADVLVIGAGPAGCITALNLAPFLRVLVIDKGGEPAARIGECLPAAAGRLLRDMRLYESFLAQRHLPCRVLRSAWGGDAPYEQDEMRNLDGHGWHLERRRFDAWLRDVTLQRGAALVTDTVVRGFDALEQAAADRRVWLERHGRPLAARARFVVDASGRHAVVGRRLGGNRQRHGRLVCGWICGRDGVAAREGGGSELHAEPDGWWYTACLPGGRRILAFYTDADLPAARALRSGDDLLARAGSVPALARLLMHRRFRRGKEHGVCAAHGGRTESVGGKSWLAVGDAAMTFDPLSSQGIFNAIYTGLAAADAILRRLDSGDETALRRYRAHLQGIWRAYSKRLDECYRRETRWRDMPFWRRRAADRAAGVSVRS